MDKWEKVIDDPPQSLFRSKVPGGWLYRFGDEIEFVPAAPRIMHTAPAQAQQDAFPVMRRSVAQVPTPKPDDFIDVEYTEVPPEDINGDSEIIYASKIDD